MKRPSGNANEAIIIHRNSLSELRCALCTVAPAFDDSSLHAIGRPHKMAILPYRTGSRGCPSILYLWLNALQEFRKDFHRTRRHVLPSGMALLTAFSSSAADRSHEGTDQIIAMATPAAALKATTSSGGARQATSRTKPVSAMPKSGAVWTEVVHTGLYSAAPSRPTTAALTPRITACAPVRFRKELQNGSAPSNTSMPGRKMPMRPAHAPASRYGSGTTIA